MPKDSPEGRCQNRIHPRRAVGSQGGNGPKFFQNHRDGDTRPSGRLTQQGIIDTTTGSDDHQLVRNGVNDPKAPGLGRSENTD